MLKNIGKLLMEQIKKRPHKNYLLMFWKDHFEQLNCDNNNNPENQNIIYNSEEVDELLDKPFTEEEIQRLIR